MYSTTEPVISPASHMFQSGFFFSLRGVKEILNKMVFVNWAEVGGGRLIILAVLASDQREMLFIRAQDIIQPK